MTKYIGNLERNARSKERWAGFASGNIDSLGSTKHTVSLGLSQQCIVRKVAFSKAYGIKVTVYRHPPMCVFDARVKFSSFEYFSLFFFLPTAFDKNILGKHNITYSISN